MVEPPRNRTVNKTMMRVVVTKTRRFSDSNSKCKLSANAMAPLRPENNINNHIQNEMLELSQN